MFQLALIIHHDCVRDHVFHTFLDFSPRYFSFLISLTTSTFIFLDLQLFFALPSLSFSVLFPKQSGLPSAFFNLFCCLFLIDYQHFIHFILLFHLSPPSFLLI